MKKLTGLTGKPSISDESLEGDLRTAAEKMLPTFRQMLMAHVANAEPPKDPEKAIGLWQVGMKVRSATDEVELENADFDALKDAVKSNGGRYSNHYQAQLFMKMKEWSKDVEKPKE